MKKASLSVLAALFLLFCGCGKDVPGTRTEIRNLIDQSYQLSAEREYEAAMDAAIQAQSLAEEVDDPEQKAEAMCAIALIDQRVMRDAQAWDNACSAEIIARKHHLDWTLCEALLLKGRTCSFASVSEESNRDDEAIGYLTEAYRISQEKDFSEKHVRACLYLSEVYVNKNRWNRVLVPEYYRLAGEYLDEGERLAAADSLKDLLRGSISFRVRYLRQGGDTDGAIGYCEKILFMSDSLDWLTRQQIYDQLTVLYASQGEVERSVESHQDYVHSMQEYIQQRSDSRLQALEDQYALLVQEHRAEQTRRIVIALVGLLAVVLLFFLQTVRFNRRIKRQNEELAKADASKKNLLEAISSDLVDVASLPGVNDMMELAQNSYAMDEAAIRKAVEEKVKASSSLDEVVADYFYKIILHRKNTVERSGLTEREIEVLRLCSRGLTAATIADILHISPRTVANHKQNIYAKLGVKSTSEMVYKAKEEGLL